MLPHYKKITLLLAILVLGGCSSKKSDEIEPQATSSSLPKTVKVELIGSKNPTYYSYTWKGNLLASYTKTTLNTSTNRDFVETYEFTRNDKNQIKTEKYSNKGASYADGSQTYDYVYNTDGSEITDGGRTKWIYNSNGQLASYDYTTTSINSSWSEKFVYDNIGRLTKYQYKSNIEGNYTMSDFTTIENPLYKFTENTQFLKLTYSGPETHSVFVSKIIPRSFVYKEATSKITYTLDDQQRVSTITVIASYGTTLCKFTIGY